MSEVRELHTRAMDAAEAALGELRSGHAARALTLNTEAFELERQAATLALNNGGIEPTQSVLLRSAATLALRCRRYRDGERLVAKALSGDPPNDVAEELRDLLEQINFERHLELRGVALSNDELQLSIAGAGVGYGFAPKEEFVKFVKRIDTMEKLMHRTAAYQAKQPYRDRASALKPLRDQLRVFVSVPRAASLAVTLRIGRDKDQSELFRGPAAEAIDELMTRLQDFNDGRDAELRQRITDESYYTNFVGLAKQLAPSGTKVRQVGLTARTAGVERKVALTRRREEVVATATSVPAGIESVEKRRTVTITGVLKYANSTKPAHDSIKIEGETGTFETVRVPSGMMADIVRPLWGTRVTIQAERQRKQLHLLDIVLAEPTENE